MLDIITVFAPATIGNVCCGFDVLGLAIAEPGDRVIVRRKKRPGVTIVRIHGDDRRLPLEADKNTAGVAILRMLDYLNRDEGFEVEIFKQMPLASGLGSSAASAVAAVVAANELLGRPLSRKHLLPFVIEAERIACGAGHADNVAPAMLGGLVLIRSYQPLDVISIPTPANLHVAVVHPNLELRTEDARRVLPETIALKTGVQQWGNVAGLIAGMMSGDFDLIGRSMQDVVAEPVRAGLIQGFYAVKSAAIKTGALGCSISGSGPSLFALCPSGNTAQRVGQAMEVAFLNQRIGCTVYISEVNKEGAQIVD